MGTCNAITQYPFHTGGAGAVRPRDKGFHRIVRGCPIDRFVIATFGDSLARGLFLNRGLLLRLRDAFAAHPLTLVPGTVSVRARAGEELIASDPTFLSIRNYTGQLSLQP